MKSRPSLDANLPGILDVDLIGARKMRLLLSAAGSRVCLAIVALALTVGCETSARQPQPGGKVQRKADPTNQAHSNTEGSRDTGKVIISNGPITVEDGKVTYGPPKVTAEVEKEIYRSLSYYRNLANAIEQKVPGGNRGSQQTRQDYDIAAKSFMVRYGISEADIESILKKGDAQGWK